MRSRTITIHFELFRSKVERLTFNINHWVKKVKKSKKVRELKIKVRNSKKVCERDCIIAPNLNPSKHSNIEYCSLNWVL